jgi:2-iminobutanoate/2-iminopropanoate deaminase
MLNMRTPLLALSACVLFLASCTAPAAQEAGEARHLDVEHYAFGGTAPLSEAVRVGHTIYLSGKLGIGRDMPRGIEPETQQAMENIKASLEEKGASMSDVVKCTIFLADMAEWSAMNGVYGTYFPENPPARSAVGANGLAADARVEIECIAVKGT